MYFGEGQGPKREDSHSYLTDEKRSPSPKDTLNRQSYLCSTVLSSLESLDNTNGQAGLIIGQECDPEAAFCSILLEEITGHIYKEFRLSKGGKMVREWEHRLHVPSWLKLNRKGDQFKAYTSHHGQQWHLAFSISMPVGQNLYWGMVVKNIAPAPLTVGIFEQLSIRTEYNSHYPSDDFTPSEQPKFAPFSESKFPDTYSAPLTKHAAEQEQWVVFPNPAQDYLEVTLPIWKDDHATLLLLNSIGRKTGDPQWTISLVESGCH